MGAPVFQVQDLLRQNNVELFSSNYTLFADMSARVMATLERLAPAVEVYSIDEAFISLDGMGRHFDLTAYGQDIRATVEQCTGIPVCVGMAPSKTLAKLANHAAKTYRGTGGVVDLTDRARQRKLMALLPVNEVWGVGKRNHQRLQALGIETALQLADASPSYIREHFSVVMERTVRELNGESCLALADDAPAPKKQIVVSRSFGEKVTDQADMRSALTTFASRAAEKLRTQGQEARVLTVFARTSAFGAAGTGYSNSATGTFERPTNDTRSLIGMAMRLLDQIWRDGQPFAKAGVMLGDFWAAGSFQEDLFQSTASEPRSEALMTAMDAINRMAKGKVVFASQNLKNDWQAKQSRLSPSYTTRWPDIPIVS